VNGERAGMCTRPFMPKPRRNPRRIGPRPRRDVGHPRRDRDRDVAVPETYCMVENIKHFKYGSAELLSK